jgi:hypothetical protein
VRPYDNFLTHDDNWREAFASELIAKW